MSGWSLAELPDPGADGAPAQTPHPLLAGTDKPADYDADRTLLEAASVAITLGQPLLLTGEPGCGKSSFADHVAWRLGLDRVLTVNCRSNMELRDLFYTYDDIGRFRDQGSHPPETYLTLIGLGEAILRGSAPEETRGLREALLEDAPLVQSRQVVLLDEIDKAPRDVPNDLLGHLTGERVSFIAPELNRSGRRPVRITAAHGNQPIVICTSNSEKSLPDAFLRRCVYFHIEMPQGERLRQIVEKRAFGGATPSDLLFRSAEALFERIRERNPRKKPGLAELIGFVMALKASGWSTDQTLEGEGWRSIAAATLLKTREDIEAAEALLALDGGF